MPDSENHGPCPCVWSLGALGAAARHGSRNRFQARFVMIEKMLGDVGARAEGCTRDRVLTRWPESKVRAGKALERVG